MGGRGTLIGAVAGALTLSALFTLLKLLGLPQPLQETAQGLISDRRGRVRRTAPATRG